ncbi:MAG: ThiF family adenylyltransferase [Planctomycetes bacterium]|nr:ThiF family adenylyltransferase [Planctomycetota bacterium]
MFHQLVSHNPDLRRLLERGYALAIDGGYLVVRDIPYLDESKALQVGAFVTTLQFVDKTRVVQADHQVFFAGGVPHGMDGRPIPNLGGGPCSLSLSEASRDVGVQRSFSNKPLHSGKFDDFFAKIESYTAIISGPAIALHDATPYTFKATADVVRPDSAFLFHDTLTSRAAIGDLSCKLTNDVIAIIGLGGTGAYVLDFLAKTPVKEIRLFDFDVFHVHNAFRSPGRLDESDLSKPKVEVYRARYETFRTGVSSFPVYVNASSAEQLGGVTFAFVCVDKGAARAGIFELLLGLQIPFIDVGMGLKRKDEALGGMIRTTYYSASEGTHTKERQLAPLADAPDEEYRVNIQIAELNAMNACLAVIRFKQLRGFYRAVDPYYHSVFELDDTKIVTEC